MKKGAGWSRKKCGRVITVMNSFAQNSTIMKNLSNEMQYREYRE